MQLCEIYGILDRTIKAENLYSVPYEHSRKIGFLYCKNSVVKFARFLKLIDQNFKHQLHFVLTSIIMCSLLIIVLGKKKSDKQPKDDDVSAILPIENQQENETAETTELVHDENNN